LPRLDSTPVGCAAFDTPWYRPRVLLTYKDSPPLSNERGLTC
jgi:hypothetical protein